MLKIECRAEDIRKLLDSTILLKRIATLKKALVDKIQLCEIYEAEIDNMRNDNKSLIAEHENDLKLIESHDINMQAKDQKIEELTNKLSNNESFIQTIMNEHTNDREFIDELWSQLENRKENESPNNRKQMVNIISAAVNCDQPETIKLVQKFFGLADIDAREIVEKAWM
jgi:hypothetical protein